MTRPHSFASTVYRLNCLNRIGGLHDKSGGPEGGDKDREHGTKERGGEIPSLPDMIGRNSFVLMPWE